MIIFTPDVAYDTDKYKCIHTVGKDGRLYLTDTCGATDYIQFDSSLSAIEAFDAYVNGVAKGCRTLLLQERYDHATAGMRLTVQYDAPYRTLTQTAPDGQTVIADPRRLPLDELTLMMSHVGKAAGTMKN
jgi:hypothetical protein